MAPARRRQAVVVGAGPSGLAAALALRARGVPTTVLEAEPAERIQPGSRAVYIHRASLQILETMRPGLGSQLATAGIVWRAKRTYWKGREIYCRTYPEPVAGALPPFTSLAQQETERILVAECHAAGVEFMWDARVTDAQTSDRAVSLRTQHGGVIEADYVVAADGPRSALRRALGLKMSGSRSSNSFVVVDLEDDPGCPLPLERRFHYQHPGLGGRNVLMLPFAGGWRLDLQCHDGDRATSFSSGSGLHEWIGKVVPGGHSRRVTWVTTYSFLQVVAERFTDANRRVLLVGEAAHLFPPFGARGLNSGIADGRGAGDAIGTALKAGTSPDRTEAIDAFESERRGAAEVNRRASSAGLATIQGRGRLERARRVVAAQLASLGHDPSGEWLDAAPYGPRMASSATRAGAY